MIDPKLDISKVDFTDSRDICRFVSLMCRIAGDLGMAMPGFKPTKETNEIKQTAIKVVRKLDEVMPGMSVADAFRVVSAYDLAYRFGYLITPNPQALNKYILAAFDSMLRGNKGVDQYAMYRAIAQGLRQGDPAYFDKPLMWLTAVEGQWYVESKQGFDTGSLPDYDIHNRVDILLRADLMAYEGRNQGAYKQALRSRYQQYFASVDQTRLETLISLTAS